MIAFYGRGRWTAFLSPQFPYESHIVLIFHEGAYDPPLPNPQTMISWAPENMLTDMMSYVNERDAEDKEETR